MASKKNLRDGSPVTKKQTKCQPRHLYLKMLHMQVSNNWSHDSRSRGPSRDYLSWCNGKIIKLVPWSLDQTSSPGLKGKQTDSTLWPQPRDTKQGNHTCLITLTDDAVAVAVAAAKASQRRIQ